MRGYLIIGALLVASPNAGRAQTVRCELSIYVLSYGSEGTCVTDTPWQKQQDQKKRIERTCYWPSDEVSIFIGGRPTDPFPLAGHVFQRSSPWTDVFQLDKERVSVDEGRLILRTSGGWMAVQEWKETEPGKASFVFRLNVVPATRQDIFILQSALKRLPTLKNWDRNDDRDCSNDKPGQASLFCVLQRAIEEQMGRYHHAQPAMDIVRNVISQRWRDRYTGHILMDFNNHDATTLADIRSLFEAALIEARAEAFKK
jgi:hypothetical protein